MSDDLRRRRWGQPVDREAARAGEAARRGPKLSARERTILIGFVARYEHRETIETALREEHPDFPSFDPSLLSYYARQVRAGQLAEAARVQAELIQEGLARREVRIAHLVLRHERLSRIFLRSTTRRLDDAGQELPEDQQPAARLDVARELREIEAQIAAELNPPGRKVGPIVPPEPPGQGEASAAQLRLVEVLNTLQDRRAAAQAALAASPAGPVEKKS